MDKILLFSTPSCGQCKLVSQKFDKAGIAVEHIDCTTDEGELMTGKYGIQHVPVVIVLDAEGDIMERLSGIPAITEFVTKIKSE